MHCLVTQFVGMCMYMLHNVLCLGPPSLLHLQILYVCFRLSELLPHAFLTCTWIGIIVSCFFYTLYMYRPCLHMLVHCLVLLSYIWAMFMHTFMLAGDGYDH